MSKIEEKLKAIKVEDLVKRKMAGIVMHLYVTEIDDKLIHCGAWTFCKVTGAEVDEDLNWGAPPLGTGSFLEL